ncbi:MAG TPA: PAS domain S-box protein [Candidatus Paceibacterota bacterium]|nr:PAS domain S-box protein [Candidatus Paceibacterota bacterium]
MSIRIPVDSPAKRSVGEYIESFSSTFNLFSDMIVVTDSNANILFANEATARVTGYSVADAFNHNPGDLWGGQMEKELYERMWAWIKGEKKTYISVVHNKKKDGTLFWQETHIYPVLDDTTGEVLLFIGYAPDVSERVVAEEEMHKRAVEMELMSKHMIGRELRINDLRQEIVELKKQILTLLK